MRSGTYSAFQTQGKALTMHGAGAASTVIVGAIVGSTLLNGVLIDGLGPNEWFDCSGLQFTMSPTLPNAGGAALLVGFGCRVRITDCIVRGGSTTYVGASGLYVAQGEVHAARCAFHGGLGLAAGIGGGGNGGPAVSAFGQTRFTADRCDFFGGLGSANPAGGPVGGAALTLFQSQATLTHCTLRGGDAGAAMQGFLANPGVAIDLTGGAVVRVVGGPTDLCRAGASATNTARPAIAAAAGSVVTMHGAVPLVGSTPSAPTTTGAVTTNAPALPRLDLTGTPLPSGALAGNAPVLVDLDGLHPLAAFVFVVATKPTLVTPSPAVLGDVLVALDSAAWTVGQLDAGCRRAIARSWRSCVAMRRVRRWRSRGWWSWRMAGSGMR